jgi:DNA-binding CsgD family transcriptional regulator
MSTYQQQQAALRGRPLTARQVQILQLMANGRSGAQIGAELFITVDSVRTHARRLYAKLGAVDRAHAVAIGFAAGLLRPSDVRRVA